jgi:long-subunit fatty acid transport protein
MMLVLWTGSLAAQNSSATYGQPNPGARSMGLGGAFVAQADDATAAFANPAGLVQLVAPEISAEFRLWLYTEDGAGSGFEVSDLSTVGFLSGVYPMGKWSLALYRNQLAKFEVDDGSSADQADPWQMVSFDIVSYGLSAAYRVRENLSLGLGVARNEGSLESQSAWGSERSDSVDWSLNAGALWRPLDYLSLGAFYRQGPDLSFEPVSQPAAKSIVSPLAVLDVYGIGLAYRSPGGGLILSAEWDRVRYSGADGGQWQGEALELEDTNELHLGAEYAFLTSNPIIAVRGGAWLEPAHQWVESNGVRSAVDDDQMHYAAGMGFAWTQFKLDFAADYADTVITTSVSGIFSF